MSWIKRELEYLKESFSQIVNGILLFILASSGLVCAIFLRLSGFNGTVISFVGIIIEITALLVAFFLYRRFIIIKEEKKQPSPDRKKIT